MDSQSLTFHLKWLDDELPTLCALSVSVDDRAVWPVHGNAEASLEVFADDALAFLSENWHSLLLTQTYPLYMPTRPSRLRIVAEAAWERDDDIDSESEDAQIEDFEHVHNLATCFAGMMQLPPLWLMRQGNSMLVDNGKETWELPLENSTVSLQKLGDQIALRLAKIEKFSFLVASWHDRTNKDPIVLLSAAAGLPNNVALSLVENRLLTAPVSFDDAANDSDELRIAARVIGSLGVEQISSVIKLARFFSPATSDEKIRRLKDAVRAELEQSAHQKPHDVGSNVANAAREFLNYSSVQRIDLEEVLSRLGIALHVAEEASAEFKGLAIWGKKHGPGVIVRAENRGTPFTNSFQRVTIAHELGHLLMDGAHAIGAVDVLKGRVPAAMEQRAKAFAGEFLLPKTVTEAAWQQKNHPKDETNLRDLIEALRKKYGVTAAVAAWKLEHGIKSTESADPNLSRVLNAIVPSR